MKNLLTAIALSAILATTSGAAFAMSKETKAAVAACKKDHKGDKKAIKACVKEAKSAKTVEETAPAAK